MRATRCVCVCVCACACCAVEKRDEACESMRYSKKRGAVETSRDQGGMPRSRQVGFCKELKGGAVLSLRLSTIGCTASL